MFIKKRHGNVSFWVLILLIVFIIAAAYESKKITEQSDINYENLVVRYIDVGQGDCEIIQIPDGRNIIIDGGTNYAVDSLVREIQAFGIKRFDYVVATHPHEDHIGGLDEVIENFEIGEVYMPDIYASTGVFEDLVSAIKSKNLKVTVARYGVNMINEDGVKAQFLAPNSDSYEDLNNYSAVLKFTYKGGSFLFTGDAEKESETEMLKHRTELKSGVLKVAHHGSTTSTINQFLHAVDPVIAVIEVGEGNSYGHPHNEILELLNNINVFRTDLNGTVTIEWTGSEYKITTEK